MAQGDTNLTNLVLDGTLAVTGATTLTGATTHTGATTFTGAITANGGITEKIGSGSATVTPQGVLSLQVNQVSTAANTNETDGHTYSLPANTLSANNKGVRVRVWGATAANVNNKTIKIYLGSTVLYTTGAVAANNKDFFIEVLIVRTGAAAETALVSGHFNGTTITASTRATATEDLTTALTIKSTMTNGTGSASDITVNGFEVTALP